MTDEEVCARCSEPLSGEVAEVVDEDELHVIVHVGCMYEREEIA